MVMLPSPRRGSAFDGAVADIAAGEGAGDAGFEEVGVAVKGPVPGAAHVGAGEDEAAFVVSDFGGEPVGLGVGADEDEEAGGGDGRVWLVVLLWMSIASSVFSPWLAVTWWPSFRSMLGRVWSWSMRYWLMLFLR